MVNTAGGIFLLTAGPEQHWVHHFFKSASNSPLKKPFLAFSTTGWPKTLWPTSRISWLFQSRRNSAPHPCGQQPVRAGVTFHPCWYIRRFLICQAAGSLKVFGLQRSIYLISNYSGTMGCCAMAAIRLARILLFHQPRLSIDCPRAKANGGNSRPQK